MPAISEIIVESLPVPAAGNKVHFFTGATLRGKEAPAGFGVRCAAGGTKSFVWFHRVDGRKHLETLGAWAPKAGGLTVYDAIAKCIDRKKLIAKGVDKKGNEVDPRPERTRLKAERAKPKSNNIGGLFDQFVSEKREEGKLRSVDQIEAAFNRLAKPEIGHIEIYKVQRSDIVSMLKKIAKDSGPVMSDRVLAYVRSAFNWYAPNDDKFNSPIVKRMAKTKPKERARKRVLADDEIRDLWTALDAVQDVPACYPRFVKMLLLTATRRNEAADMHTSEIDGKLWTIPGARYKTKLDHVVPLTDEARALLGEKPARAKASWFVFSTSKSGPDREMQLDGAVAFSGFSKAKAELDKTLAAIREREGRAPMQNWTLHDLRRTARSLMSRAKVPTDHAERALGHVMGGVRETYDRYEYLDEKRAAFEALAGLISRILNPTSNVEELAARRGQA